MTNFFALIKNHKIAAALIAVVVLGGGYGWYKKAKGSTAAQTYVTEAAQLTTITSSVTGSGQVSEQNKVDVKPTGSGQLVSVGVNQGDKVAAGQIIATIDERNASLSLAQAKTQLESAQAAYDKLAAGLTSADQQINQAQLDAAQNSLNNAQTAYNNTVKAQQLAVSKAYGQLLNTSLAAVPAAINSSSATIAISGAYTGTAQGQYVLTIFATGSGPEIGISGLESIPPAAPTRGVPQALGTKGLFMTVSTTGTLNPNDTWTISLPNAQSSSYLSDNNAYQSALQAQTQAVADAQQAIKTAQINLEQAQATYNQKLEPPAQADLDSAKAQISAAQAQLQSAEIAYDNNIIRAPFDGVVAVLNNHKGDQVSSADTIATIITNEQIAELSLNEVDVSKVKVGQKAIMTFDAIDGLSLTGKVAQIDTIGTVTQGVVTYAVKVSFDSQDDRVKPGMTVNTEIITDVVTDALAVPNAAVKTQGGNAIVQVLDSNGKPQPKTVQVGISNDTLTQIVSGLNVGDQVVTQTINSNAKTTTAAQSGASGLRIPGIGGGAGAGGGGGFGGAGRGNFGGGAARGN